MAEAATKRCPYCGEDVRVEAIKCRWCGSLLGPTNPLTQAWHRSRDGKMIAGVCTGLAEQFSISVTILRLAFVLGTVIGGWGLLVYLVLWAIMPYRRGPGRDVVVERPSG